MVFVVVQGQNQSMKTSKSARTQTAKGRAVPDSKGPGVSLMIQVPAQTMMALKLRAAAESTTTRALVLDALKAVGYPVATGEVTDRRRR